MNILLTNDDGYSAQGIQLVKTILSKYAHVVIVAPKGAMSAKSCSKTFGKPLKVVEEEKDVFSCEGTPADCVAIGLTSMDTKFDLVVSGCNNGINIANDILYSGTIGACSESLTYGVPAIALSCEFNFEIVEKYLDEVWKFVIDHKLIGNDYILNINFPKGEVVKDIQLGHIHYRKDNNYFVKTEDGYQAYRDVETVFTDKESDCYQIENGIVSIVPLARSFFSKEAFDLLKTKMK